MGGEKMDKWDEVFDTDANEFEGVEVVESADGKNEFTERQAEILIKALNEGPFAVRKVLNVLIGLGAIDSQSRESILQLRCADTENENTKTETIRRAYDFMNGKNALIKRAINQWKQDELPKRVAVVLCEFNDTASNILNSGVSDEAGGLDLLGVVGAQTFVLDEYQGNQGINIEACIIIGERGSSFFFLRPKGEEDAQKIIKFNQSLQIVARQES